MLIGLIIILPILFGFAFFLYFCSVEFKTLQIMDFENCSFIMLFDVVKHHCEILGRASEIRLLNDSELDFMLLIPLFESGIISKFDFRLGAIKYFE